MGGWWWLRSPNYNNSNNARDVNNNGNANNNNNVNNENGGVSPDLPLHSSDTQVKVKKWTVILPHVRRTVPGTKEFPALSCGLRLCCANALLSCRKKYLARLAVTA